MEVQLKRNTLGINCLYVVGFNYRYKVSFLFTKKVIAILYTNSKATNIYQ